MLDGHRDPAFAWDWREARSTPSTYTFDPFQPFQLNTPGVRSSVPSHRPHWWGLSCLTSGFCRSRLICSAKKRSHPSISSVARWALAEPAFELQ